ncbi:uncharacterized protein P884DRAFT_298052 [Thermothelomyces heterothallicus CBS 202.75]|uniref:uncharacterized protein n=1 Tax=Thermothelomyces heterothallicus CBS 202.75 TaxID=1149848 RepID=UPI0037426C16
MGDQLLALFELGERAYAVARWLWKTANETRKAPDTWDMLHLYLKRAKKETELMIEEIEDLLREPSVAEESSVQALKLLQADLLAYARNIETYLKKEQPQSIYRRIDFAIQGQADMRELLEQMELHARNVVTWLYLLDRKIRRKEAAPKALNSEVLQFHDQDKKIRVPGVSRLSAFNASYKRSPDVDAIDVKVLVESVERQHDDPDHRIVFLLPSNTGGLQTMREAMADDGATPPLEEQFDLARQLTDAVLMLSAAKLMHKNIRSDTVLLLRPSTDDNKPDAARGYGDTEDRLGPGLSEWHLKLYRHPAQQKPSGNDKYVLGHDVYALGMCLLEIGLWSPLIVAGEGGLPSASYYLREAGGQAARRWIKTELKAAWNYKQHRDEEPTYELNELVELVLKDEVTTEVVLEMKKRRQKLRDKHPETAQMIKKVIKKLTEDGTRHVSTRLKVAIEDTLLDLLEEDQRDGSTTLQAAKEFEDAVTMATKSEKFQENMKKIIGEIHEKAKRTDSEDIGESSIRLF